MINSSETSLANQYDNIHSRNPTPCSVGFLSTIYQGSHSHLLKAERNIKTSHPFATPSLHFCYESFPILCCKLVKVVDKREIFLQLFLLAQKILLNFVFVCLKNESFLKYGSISLKQAYKIPQPSVALEILLLTPFSLLKESKFQSNQLDHIKYPADSSP